jgi:hypothetical protein
VSERAVESHFIFYKKPCVVHLQTRTSWHTPPYDTVCSLQHCEEAWKVLTVLCGVYDLLDILLLILTQYAKCVCVWICMCLCKQVYIHTCIHTYHICIYIHTYIPWTNKCVIKILGCGTSHKYTNIQIYSVKHYKHITKMVP